MPIPSGTPEFSEQISVETRPRNRFVDVVEWSLFIVDVIGLGLIAGNETLFGVGAMLFATSTFITIESGERILDSARRQKLL